MEDALDDPRPEPQAKAWHVATATRAAECRHDSIVIDKDGKPVAALVDAELFARIRRMQERFDALSQRIADAYATVPADAGLAEIDAAVAAARCQR